MLPLLILLASPAPAIFIPEPIIREIRQGPTPFAERTLSQPHPNSDDRMFPDLAIKDLRIDGDTLYVRVANQARGATQVPVLVAARALSNGARSDLAQVRTTRLAGGESRWVALKGFSIRTASTAQPVFALANASAVSAVARLVPSTAGMLDRSGRGCQECVTEMDETNNVLTLSGAAIGHGAPR